jgi:hypothetical protein
MFFLFELVWFYKPDLFKKTLTKIKKKIKKPFDPSDFFINVLR